MRALLRLPRRLWHWTRRRVAGRGAEAALVTALVVAALIYPLRGASYFSDHPLVFSSRRPRAGMLTSAFVVFAVVFVVAVVAHHLLDQRWRDRVALIARRTGLRAMEFVALLLSVATLVVALVSDWRLLPLGGAGLVAFGILHTREVELRPVTVARSVVEPPGVPQANLQPTSEEPELARRSFVWEVATSGRAFRGSLDVAIDVVRYERARDTNPYRSPAPPALPDWEAFVVKGFTSEVVAIVEHFLAMSRENELSTYLEICNVLAFVQSFPYTEDVDTTGYVEYFRYPVETLFDSTGDCEDTSILAASILLGLGHRVAMLECPGHAAIAVAGPEGLPGTFLRYDGVPFYYCETTDAGWIVGEAPEGLSRDDITFVALTPSLIGTG